jgi:hypothetical protein
MPKRCIGIDIGRTHLCAAQVVRTAEGFQLEKAFAMPTRRSTDSLPAILHSLTDEHGFDRRAEVAVSLPLHTFFFADIEADAKELELIRTTDITRLKDYFPIPAEQLITQVCSVLRLAEGKYSTLVAASSREQLHEGLQSLSDGKIKPTCLDTPITAVHAALVHNYAESTTGLAVILYADETTLNLAVTRDGSILLVRNIPVFSSGEQNAPTFAQQAAEIVAQEIEITWRRLFGNAPDPGLRIFLVAPGQRRAPLASCLQEKISGQVIPVDPYAHVARAEDVDEDLPVCVAEGLALRILQPQGTTRVDFLAAYRARTRPKLRMRRELTVCAALGAAAAVVWGAGLFLQLSSLESRYEHLKQQAREVFRQAVPEETNIIDPVAQLQQRLDAFHKESEILTCLHAGHPAPLEIVDTLSRHTPATAGLKLEDVLIVADSVRIRGSCDSFATFSQWQRGLESIPGWRIVDVPRPTREDQSGKVRFTISLSTAESEA